MRVAPDADLDDATFDGGLGRPGARSWRFFANLRRCSRSATSACDEVTDASGAGEVEISADRPFAVYADGEHREPICPRRYASFHGR